MASTIARVLLDSPLPQLDHLFDYRIPESLAADVSVGVRVTMPLRSTGRMAQGWVVELADRSEFGGVLAELKTVVSPVPTLSPLVYSLARRVADRQAGTASDVVRLAIPARHVRAEKAHLASVELESEPVIARELSGYAVGTNLVQPERRAALTAIPRLVMSDDSALPHWCATFAELATQALATEQSAILVVPDYRDQEVLERALAAVIPADRIVTVDARQSNAERYRNHLRLLRGGSFVVVGNRSALYSPIANAALIALWDDSDQAYVEPHAPGAHARDVALLRQEITGCALVVARFTPSLDVHRLISVGWLQSVEPARTERPRVILEPEPSSRGLSSQAFSAAKEASRTGPVLLQVSNPGYSTAGMCANCHAPARCGQCAGALYFRSAGAPPQCRVCGAMATTWSCTSCHEQRIQPVGAAAGRTAEELGRAFPGLPIVISDGERQLTTVADQPALVIATRGAEPIATRGYRAVVLLDAARMLAREGLHVAEDAFRAWSNAAGLAAPDAPVFLPHVDGPLAQAFATWSMARWTEAEFADRAQLGLPPAVRVASVTAKPTDIAEVRAALSEVDQHGRIELIGPQPADEGNVRLIVKYEYALGTRLAADLKAIAVRAATRRRGGVPGRRQTPAIVRVRMDDSEVFA